MKNKHGQVFVLFIIMIPIILFMFGSIIEFSIVEYNKKKVYSVTKSIIASEINNPNEEKIKELFNDNGIDGTINIDTTDGLTIEVKTSIDSFLGSIINIDEYDIKYKIKGYLKDNKVIYEKGA